MRNPPQTSLNVHVDWPTCAEILGVAPGSRALPATTTCPLCGGHLTVYQDSTTRGAWHYCFDCKSAGELTELAAAVWQVPLPSAIRRLAAEGVAMPSDRLTDEAIDRYVQDHPSYRKTFEALWQRAQRRLLFEPVPEMAALRKRLGLLTFFSRERLVEGPGKLFGIAPDTDVEKCFFTSPNYHARTGGRGVLFHGRKGYVLVIPYYSAPQRIGAFAFLKPGNDLVLRPLRSATKDSHNEIGLVGLTEAIQHSSATILGVQDPLLLLRMQVKHFHHSLLPLPLVAWGVSKTGQTRNTWAALGHKQIVLWALKFTPELLKQCQRTDAKLIVCGPTQPTNKAVGHYLRQQPPAELVRQLVQQAKPWREVVRHWLKTGPEGQTTVLIRELIDDDEGLELLRQCDPKHPRLEAQPSRIRLAHYNGSEYVEQSNRWFLRKQGKELLVFPGVVEVHKVVMRGQKLRYHGEIRTEGKATPFEITGEDVRNSTHAALITAMLKHGQVLPPVRGTTNLIRLAMQFRDPRIVKGKTHVGWIKRSFRFKHFSLTEGRVFTHAAEQLPAHCPGPAVRRFRCGKGILDQLGKAGRSQEQLWAVLVSVLTAACAAPKGLAGQGIVFGGLNTRTPAEAIMRRLGVPVRGFRDGYDSSWTQSKSKWPVYVKMYNSSRSGRMLDWLIDSSLPRLIHNESLIIGYTLAAQGLNVVRWPEPIPAQAIADFPLEHALLAFLRYFTARPKGWVRTGNPWLDTCEEVAQWLEDEGRDGTVVRQAVTYAVVAGRADVLPRLAAQLYQRGVLTVDGHGAQSLPTPIVFDAEGLRVSATQLREAVAKLNLPVPPVTGETLVTRALLRSELEPWR